MKGPSSPEASSPPDLFLVLPPGHEEVSGGNQYNLRLREALQGRQPVHCLDGSGWRRHLANESEGVILVDTLNLAEAGELLPGRGTQPRHLLLVHHLPSLEPPDSASPEDILLEERTLPLFDGFLATSPFTTNYLAGRGVDPGALLTVPPALDPVSPTGRSLASPLRALLVGNLIPRKGVEELLQQLHAKLRPEDEFQLDILGRSDLDPEYSRRCHDLLQRSPDLAARVSLRGPVPHEQVLQRMDLAHLLLSVSSMETYGMALQEAAARQLPILALDGGHACRHFRHGQNGWCHPTRAALADHLLELVRNPSRMREVMERTASVPRVVPDTWDDAADSFLRQLSAFLAPRS